MDGGGNDKMYVPRGSNKMPILGKRQEELLYLVSAF